MADNGALSRLSEDAANEGRARQGFGDYVPFGNGRDLPSGFRAQAYINEQTKEVVIAVGPTDPTDPADLGADTAFVTGGYHQQFHDGLKYALEVQQDVASEYGDVKEYDFSVTGFSLGGGIAQVIAHTFGWDGSTFDAPQASGIVDSNGYQRTLIELGLKAKGAGKLVNYTEDGSAVSSVPGRSYIGEEVELDLTVDGDSHMGALMLAAPNPAVQALGAWLVMDDQWGSDGQHGLQKYIEYFGRSEEMRALIDKIEGFDREELEAYVREQQDLADIQNAQKTAAGVGQGLGFGVAQFIALNNDLDDLEQTAVTSLTTTLGENLGEWLQGDARVEFDGLEFRDTGEGAWGNFASELSDNTVSSGINTLSQTLSDDVVEELDWNEEWSTVADSVVDYGASQALHSGAQNLFGEMGQSPDFAQVSVGAVGSLVTGQMGLSQEMAAVTEAGFDEVAATWDGSTFDMSRFNFQGFAAAAVTSLAMDELGIGETEEGAIGATVGSMIGFAIGGPVGSAVGQLIGGAVGDMFGGEPVPPPPPPPEGTVYMKLTEGGYQLAGYEATSTAPLENLVRMGESISGNLNRLLDATGAQLANPEEVGETMTLRFDAEHMYLNGEPYAHDDGQDVVMNAIRHELQQWQLEGGDIWTKRALLNSDAATVEELFADTRAGRLYGQYQQRPEIFDERLADPDVQQAFRDARRLESEYAELEQELADLEQRLQKTPAVGIPLRLDGLPDDVLPEGSQDAWRSPRERLKQQVEEARAEVEAFRSEHDIDPGTGRVRLGDELDMLRQLDGALKRVRSGDLDNAHPDAEVRRLDVLMDRQGVDLRGYSLDELVVEHRGNAILLSALNTDGTLTIDNWLAYDRSITTLRLDDGTEVNLAALIDRLAIRPGEGPVPIGDAMAARSGSADTLLGTGLSDVLVAHEGDVTLQGGEGTDTLIGDAGDQVFSGGAAGDALIGGGGADTVDYGESGAPVGVDLARGAGVGGEAAGDELEGVENVMGSDHHDRLLGDEEANRLSGGRGDDAMRGRGGGDALTGGSGADHLEGDAGVDRLGGGRGDDALAGGEGSDLLAGGADADRLSGEAGDDRLRGGAGDDVLAGGAGSDMIDGGSGDDTAVFAGAASSHAVALADDDGSTVLVRNLETGGVDRLRDVERLRFADGVTVDVEALLEAQRGSDLADDDEEFGRAARSAQSSGPLPSQSRIIATAAALGLVAVPWDETRAEEFVSGSANGDGAGASIRHVPAATEDQGVVGTPRLEDGLPRAVEVPPTVMDRAQASPSAAPARGGVSDTSGPVAASGGVEAASTPEAPTNPAPGAGTPMIRGPGRDRAIGQGSRERTPAGGGENRTQAGTPQDESTRAGAAPGPTVAASTGDPRLASNADARVVGDAASNRLDAGGGEDVVRGRAGDDVLRGDAPPPDERIEVPLRLEVTSAGPPEATVLLISGVPEGARLSAGQPAPASSDALPGSWRVTADELDGLALELPVERHALLGEHFELTVVPASLQAAPPGGMQRLVYGEPAMLRVELPGIPHGDDDLLGGAGEDVLLGQDGDDLLDGGSGADELFGGGGEDALHFDARDARVDGGGGFDVARASGAVGITAGTVFAGIERLDGTSYDDVLVTDDTGTHIEGGAGSDELQGGQGDDTLVGGQGADLLFGGGGDDELRVDTDDLADGNDFISGGPGTDHLIQTDDGPISVDLGATGIEHVRLGGGNDAILAGAAANAIDGGGGVDQVSYGRSEAGVHVDIAAGTAAGGHAEGDRLDGVEHLSGSAHADTLIGDDGDNILRGDAGSDVLEGGGGRDVAAFAGSHADYEIEFTPGSRAATVTHREAGDVDTLAGIEEIRFDEREHGLDTVFLDGTNNGPIRMDDAVASLELDEDTTLTLSRAAAALTGAFLDYDGDPIRLTRLQANSLVTADIQGDLLHIRGKPDESGGQTIHYTVTDGNGGTARAPLELTVNAVNDAPYILADKVRADVVPHLNVVDSGNPFNSDQDFQHWVDGTLPVHDPDDSLGDLSFELVDNRFNETHVFNEATGQLDLYNRDDRQGGFTIRVTDDDGAWARVDAATDAPRYAAIDTARGGGQTDGLFAIVQDSMTAASPFELDAQDLSEFMDRFGMSDGLLGRIAAAEAYMGRAAVALDLDGDGLEVADIDDSSVRLDANSDGESQRVAWLDADDGWLTLDGDGNGRTRGFDEINIGDISVFADSDPPYSAMEALLVDFDSNGDGRLTEADARWSDFRVWHDVGGDGIGSPDELIRLDAAGIDAISLHADGQAADLGDIRLAGRSTVRWADGHVTQAGDVAVSYEPTLNLTSPQGGTMAPVALDLDGDGLEFRQLAESNARLDADGDGVAERVAWVGADDAWLALDRDADGSIDGIDEISFVGDHPAARTDMEGLALAFDSNGDGRLTASDERWEDFAVWRDADGDGTSAHDEIVGLDEAGIRAIDLRTDGVSQDLGDVRLAGRSTVEWADGRVTDAGDAAVRYVDGSAADEGNAVAARPGSTLLSEGGLREAVDELAQAGAVFTAGDAPELPSVQRAEGLCDVVVDEGWADEQAVV